MKNKKGFTLVELIGVILILSILLLITVPAIIELLDNSKTKKSEELSQSLELAAETYVEQNRDLFPELDNIGAKAFIRVGTLIDAELVKDNIKGVNEEDIDNFTIIATTGNDNIITYKYVNMDSDLSGYVKNNLILHYDGYHQPEGNIWEDLSGNGNNGTLVNFTFPLSYDNGVNFDGINDYINSGNSSMLNITDALTLSVTFKMTSATFSGGLIIKGLNGGWASNAYLLRNSGLAGNVLFNIADGTTNNRVTCTNIKQNQWINITAVTSKASGKLIGYINGKSIGEVTRTINDIIVVADPLILGVGYGYTTFFQGKIGSAMIYNRALTPEEVKANFEVDKNRFDI
ncbi:MAG: LamG domain-containing protein [Ignavibacteriales bacterium]